MTRFTRAKGSKASNERVPEKATAWADMKKQLDEKKKDTEEEGKRKQAEAQRRANYNTFLEEYQDEQLKNSNWADFPQNATNNNTVKKKKMVASNAEGTMKQNSDENEACNDNQTVTKQTEKKKKAKNKKDHSDLDGKQDSIISNEEKKQNLDENEVFNDNQTVTKQTEKKKKANNKRDHTDLDGKQDSVNSNEICNKEKTLLDSNETNHKLGTKQKRKRNRKRNTKELDSKRDLINFNENSVKNEEPNDATIKSSETFNKKRPSEENGSEPKRIKGADNSKNKRKDRNNDEAKRRKPNFKPDSMIINGIEVAIGYVEGFPVKKEDCERLKTLRKQMISKGLPRSEIQRALKLERRRAEKALARERKKVCFNCRKAGHVLSECPNLNNTNQQDMITSGICFKCGSTEHTHFECKVVKKLEYKYATCFICREQGHITNQCPDNPRGVYPKGGACKLCGEVTHLRKDCPKYQAEKEESNICLDKIDSNIEALDGEDVRTPISIKKAHTKVIKF